MAAHVLARRRWEVTTRFGLRASPGGLATPVFGDPVECIRIAGSTLIRELGGSASVTPIHGATLRDLARFAGTDIDLPFECGADTPDIGPPDEALDFDDAALAELAAWYATGWRILDTVISGLAQSGDPAVIQLWPEHFDAGTNVEVGGGRVNLGCSPGDSYEDEPYLYVGPWGADRPGDAAYWNAPFGATVKSATLALSDDAVATGVAFMRMGLTLLSSPNPAP